MFFNRSWGIAVMLASAGLAAPAVANTQMPPVEGPWAPSDYVEAIFAVQNGRITLPRRGNSKTEAIFDRLIDRGNIDQLMAGAESAAKKRQQILLILSATGEFRGRYGYAVALGDDVQNELIDIQIFRLALIDQLAALGVQPDKLLVSQPDSGEQALEICEQMVHEFVTEPLRLVFQGAHDIADEDIGVSQAPGPEHRGSSGGGAWVFHCRRAGSGCGRSTRSASRV